MDEGSSDELDDRFNALDGLEDDLVRGQVWSLSLFYSIDFSQSRTCEKSAFSTNVHSRFASVVVDSVLGHLTRSLQLCSSGSNEGCESRVRDGNKAVAGRNGREIVFPQWGSLYKKETENNQVSVQTWWGC